MPMTPGFEYASLVVGQRGAGQDRCRVRQTESGLLVVVADGAGGLAGGAEAADAVVDRARSCEPRGAAACASVLRTLDRAMQHAPQIGESTAVLAVVSNGVIQGASVGDSVALLVGTRELHDLTGAQPRKPLLGSGEAVPVEFGAELRGRTLILATDGLHKYWRRGDAHRALTAGDAAVSLRLLVESVRLPGGSLQDDVGIVLIRPLA